MNIKITKALISNYIQYLTEEEKSPATISKYRRDLLKLFRYAGEEPTITRQLLLAFKQHLLQNYKISSCNSILAAVNGFLEYNDLTACRVKGFKLQREIFCSEKKELSRSEYLALLETAKARKDQRLYLIMQTICSTGIRVSELPFITCEALNQGEAIVYCKNKIRRILLPAALCRILKGYIKKHGLTEGPVFVTRNSKPVDRSYIWSEMKKLCNTAGIDKTKVYPHNLRHLFARTFYKKEKDIVRLSDILGHCSIETTRIYTISSGREHAVKMNRLGLILAAGDYT